MWKGPDVFEQADLSCYKGVPLSLIWNLSAANVLENSFPLVNTCYKTIEGSKEKIKWMAEAVAPMCSVKRCSYKFCNKHRKISVSQFLLNKVISLKPAIL